MPALLFGTAALVTLAAPSDMLPGIEGSRLEAKEGLSIPIASRKADESSKSAVAVLAGGCFWGVEAVFEHMRGVKSVTSGYAGGTKADADYSTVSGGATRHAEAVRIVYDPDKVRYDQLLRVYFGVAHDPTQKDRQGPDTGPQYRSAIFPQNAEQRAVAKAYMAQLAKARVYAAPIATTIEDGAFFPAEKYHQNFMTRNPGHAYILRWDKPKLAAFKKLYPGYYSSSPAS